MEQDGKTIAEVLAEVQGRMEQPKLNAKVNYGNTKFKYADLSELWRVVNAACEGSGLWVYHDVKWQETENGMEPVGVATVISYKGESIEVALVPANMFGKPQDVGSSLTYAKRYSLAMAFGLAADEDDDGQAAAAAQYQPKPARSKQQPKRRQKSASERIEDGIKAITDLDGCPLTREMIVGQLNRLETDEARLGYLADAYKSAKSQMVQQQA